jgi:tight adherence protein B
VRRGVLAAALGAALVVAAASPAAASARIRSYDQERYPTIRLTLATDHPAPLTSLNVRVTENGVPVDVTALRRLTGSTRDVQVVLAIDVSNSMAGTELDTALAAAREFVEHVPEWISVGVVAFADEPRVVSDISSDRASVTTAVESMGATTSPGTALFGAVAAAAQLFRPGGQHNVIVLTDGHNTRPGTLDEAVASARRARATLFTIGIDGGDPDAAVLGELAKQTGGAYRLQSTDRLSAAYRSLALELSQQYVIEYRSKTPYGDQAHVIVSVPGGTAEATFRAPSLPGPPPGSQAGLLDRIVGGDLGGVIVVLLVFVAMLMFMNLVTTMYEETRRSRDLRQRFLAPGGPQDAAPTSAGLVPRPLTDAIERGAEAAGAARGVAHLLERAGWKVGVGEFLVPSLFLPLVVGLILSAAVTPILGGIVLVVGWLVPMFVLLRAGRKRVLALQGQLADVLMILASSLRAGHSFLQALDSVAKEIDEPAASEFARALSEIQLGRTVDDALMALSQRIGSMDLEWAVTAINIQRKSGGNLAEVLETVAATIRERETLRRQVRALSAEGRWSAVILIILPFVILAYMLIVSPGYLEPLLASVYGKLLLAFGGVLMIVGYAWMRKIVRFDV